MFVKEYGGQTYVLLCLIAGFVFFFHFVPRNPR